MTVKKQKTQGEPRPGKSVAHSPRRKPGTPAQGAPKAGLRSRAEKIIRGRKNGLDSLSHEDMETLIHELETHKIELELQNEDMRLAQLSLEDSRKRYADLYDFAPIGYLTFNRKGLIVEVNITAASMLGLQKAALVGRAFAFYLRKGYAAVFNDHIRLAAKAGRQENCIVELARRDRTTFFAELISIPQEDGTIRTAMIDTSERRRIEDEVARLQALYVSILDSSAEGIYGIDLSGNHSIVNRAAVELLGYTVEEIAGKHSHPLWHHTRADGTPYPEEECKIYATLRDGIPRRVTGEVFWRRDGTSIPVEYTVAPIRKEGDIAGAVIVFRDVTERGKTEALIRKTNELSEARNRINDLITSSLSFEQIVNTAIGEAARSVGAEAALIGLFNEDGFMVKYSYGAFETLVGHVLRREEFKALAVLEGNGSPIVSPDAQEDDRISPVVARRFGVHAAMFFPIFISGSVKGSLAFFNLSSRTFDLLETDSAGKIAFSLSLALENAGLYEECRASEENLKRKSAELEKKSTELERSNRDLEQFASVASHDLQAPLVSLGSALKLSLKRLKDTADEETLQVLSDAMFSSANMQRMVRNLLAYSRVGREPSFEDTDLKEVLDLSVRNLQTAMENLGAAVTHGPLPRVHADPILLSQLFQNLIGNAIKYRSERRPEVHVAAEQTGEGYLVSVRDNGIGIPDDEKELIFQIFKRASGGKGTPGSGIGLATCKKIAELHGGRIWVESTEGEGSCFFFTLPAVQR